MSRFDRLILSVVLGLGLVIAALSVASARLGPAVDSMAVADSLDGTSVNTQIGLTFTESMNLRSVERNFRVQPQVPGDFTLVGNEVFFRPRHSLSYGTVYHVTIAGEATNRSGKRLSHAFHGTFVTQTQHLLYLGSQGSDHGHLVLAAITGKKQAVSGDGTVGDFSLSYDRSLAVYTKSGGAGERTDELWLLSLADNSTQRIYRNPQWNMSQAHFSPDGRSVVFLATNVLLCQKYYGCYRDKSGPLVFLLDLGTRRAKQFSAVNDVPITNFVDFSPAGQIAYTDLGSALTLADPNGRNVVHIPNLGNSLEFAGFDRSGDKAAFVGQTPDSSGGDILVYVHGKYIDVSRGVYDSAAPAFSSSGSSIAYVAYRGERGIEPIYGISVYNFAARRTRHLTSSNQWSDWNPRWSLDDHYICFVRSQPQEAMYMGSGEVWVMKSNGTNARPLGSAGVTPQWVS